MTAARGRRRPVATSADSVERGQFEYRERSPGYATVIVDGLARDVLSQYATRNGIAVELSGVHAQIRIWYNSQLEFKHFMAIS